MSLQEAAYRLLEDSCLRDQPGPDRRRTSPSDDPGRVHVGMDPPFTPEATEAFAVPVPGVDATNTQGFPSPRPEIRPRRGRGPPFLLRGLPPIWVSSASTIPVSRRPRSGSAAMSARILCAMCQALR